ncbi:DUF2884 family protein [Microbulbifer sp. ARAS458-1]|uniref:DUF2884 family protein n=1 Tax=Microbulbifer sp. ARAS458-1 TaxID=3140242 RepID=UPI003877D174
MKPLLPLVFSAAFTFATVSVPMAAAATEENKATEAYSRQCNIDIHHQVTVGPGFLEVWDVDSGGPLFAFNAPDQLAVGNTGLLLTAQQQELMEGYQQGLHSAGREVSALAIAAVDVATEGMGIALVALAGPDDSDTRAYLADARRLRDTAAKEMEQPGEVFTYGSPWVEGNFSTKLESELEPQIADLTTRFAGKIAWHAMKAALTGGASIEERAEAAAEEAEKIVEAKAEVLEARADSLCEQVQELDQLELALHKAIPELNGIELINTK